MILQTLTPSTVENIPGPVAAAVFVVLVATLWIQWINKHYRD